jgi:hypothetical protein
MTRLDGSERKQNYAFTRLSPAEAMPARITGGRINIDYGVIWRASGSCSPCGVSDRRGQWNNAED